MELRLPSRGLASRRVIIDFLEGGETIDQFLELYPSITRQRVLAVLDFANSQILECAFSLTNA
jgi:uncharacterized protein (DUF433 family)